MYYGACHVGIWVTNMEKALVFYRDILGLKVLNDFSGEEYKLREVIGKSVEMRVIILGVSAKLDRSCIKLVQFLSGPYPNSTYRVPFNRRWGDIGYCEFCFEVLNVEKTYTEMKEKGAESAMEVTRFSEKGADGKEVVSAYAYIRDPEGTLVEFDEPWLVRKTGTVDKKFAGIIRLDHVGFGVTDMDRSVTFYKDILGFNKVIYDIEGESAMSKLVGEPLRRRLVMLHNENDGGCIELIQAFPPFKARPLSLESRWGDIGLMEMGVEVKDIDKVCQTLVEKKVRFICAPGPVKQLNAKHAYIRDPDGLMIELIELLS